MVTQTFKQQIAMVTATALTAFALNACVMPAVPASPVTSVAPRVVNIVAKEYSFDAPKMVASGWVTVALKNEGQEPHHAQLVRLNDDVTVAQFQAALPKGIDAVMPLISMPGGPGVVDQGGSQAATVYLKPGHYFLICLVPDAKVCPIWRTA